MVEDLEARDLSTTRLHVVLNGLESLRAPQGAFHR
jgi:hypothetical protein